MQYDAIILELMSRIKKLEDDVEELKKSRDNTLVAPSQNDPSESEENYSKNTGSVAYQKMTDDMIDICYKCGKKVRNGDSAQELADYIASETGMNRNSAIMYLYAVSGMLDGTIFKRAISSKAIQRYFDTIFEEYGSEGLKKAIHATRLHVQYRRECGHKVDSIEEICDRNQRKL